MLHYFLNNHVIGECHLHLHADNCSGQNKNSCMMWYLMWRVLTGRHRSITLSFLLTGHTKFSCDWCFGLVKRLYRKTKVDCLQDIVAVVEQSSDVNLSQLCGTEDEEVIVPSFDWTTFLAQFFRKVVIVKKFHHFHFEEGSTTLRVQKYSDTAYLTQELLKQNLPTITEMPQTIQPKGLDAKRQWYLYDEIRPFTAEHCQDITTPLPAVAKPKTQKQQVEAVSSDSDDDIHPHPLSHPEGAVENQKVAHDDTERLVLLVSHLKQRFFSEPPKTTVLLRANHNIVKEFATFNIVIITIRFSS